MPDNETFGQRLRRLRKKRKYNQKTLKALIGINPYAGRSYLDLLKFYSSTFRRSFGRLAFSKQGVLMMSKDFLDFILLVKKMRECQQRYFKTRDKAILIGSKQLEASVDKFIAERHEHDAYGEWLLYEDKDTNAWECSECHEVIQLMEGSPFWNGWHYCPYCGAKMEKESRNEG